MDCEHIIGIITEPHEGGSLYTCADITDGDQLEALRISGPRFKYCPLCGQELDWDRIHREVVQEMAFRSRVHAGMSRREVMALLNEEV